MRLVQNDNHKYLFQYYIAVNDDMLKSSNNVNRRFGRFFNIFYSK